MNISCIRKSLLGLALATCSILAATADNYKLTAHLPSEAEGATLYLLDYDTGNKLDSAYVADSVLVFSGAVDKPLVGMLTIDGSRLGKFVLEDGDISFDARKGSFTGTPLNDKLAQFNADSRKYSERFYATDNDSVRQAILNEYSDLMLKIFEDNISNPVGYLMFMNMASDMAPDEIESAVTAHPGLAGYKRVQKVVESGRRYNATKEGAHFADFEIEYDGVKHRLSDVVGHGDYVLVDFWASWCGPCIRQTAVIKDIYNEYKDKGLKVLGVAVWDKPEDTLKAIRDHELTWPCWLNAQTVPTDVYGIKGIPCIILFGPDGTILSRDKQDDALRNAVSSALAPAAK